MGVPVVQGYWVWLAWPALAASVLFQQVRRKSGLWRTLGVLALATYAMWIVSVAFFPMPLLPNDHNMEEWGSVNLVPSRSFIDSLHQEDARTLVRLHGGNFLLAVPFTLLGPMLWPGLRRWWKALLLGLGMSLSIELVQFALGRIVGDYYRSVDIDDVILNVAGAMLGYGLYVWGRRRPSQPRRLTAAPGSSPSPGVTSPTAGPRAPGRRRRWPRRVGPPC